MMERKYYIIIIIIGMGSYYDGDSDGFESDAGSDNRGVVTSVFVLF